MTTLSATSRAWSTGPVPRPTRLAGAIGAAILLHVVALVARPGSTGGLASTAASPHGVLAVRILPPTPAPAVAAAQPTVAATTAPIATASPEQSAPVTPTERSPSSPRAAAERADAAAPPRPESRPTARTDPATAGASLSAAPDYLLGARLDPGPRALDDIEPDYPDTERLRSGTVVLRLLIGDSGHVDEVAVVRSDPPGVFEQAAVEAFAKARFAPGMAGGRPVKSQIRVEVEFMPINRGARTSGRSY